MKQKVKHMLQQYTSDYSNINEQILQLKKEKLALAKEDLEFRKKAHQENTELLLLLNGKMDELLNIARSIAPQYLE